MLSQKVDSIDVFLSHASCQHFKFCFVAASTGKLYIEASICIIKCLKSIMGDSGCLLTIGHLSFQGLGDFTLDETTHFADVNSMFLGSCNLTRNVPGPDNLLSSGILMLDLELGSYLESRHLSSDLGPEQIT